MKNFTFLLSFMLISLSACASPQLAAVNSNISRSGDPFIFMERGVEFAVYPDGQFDFLYNPNGFDRFGSSYSNMSYNAGYNYNPFVQYDDFGAVIQIETVPVYYDFYGRITRAGNVDISYNRFGLVDRIGKMRIHYNRFHQYTHSSGFINAYNVRYVARPWHGYYTRPMANHVIVYNQPYRAYYSPNRMDYSYYHDYYNSHYSDFGNNFQRSYYRPGEKVVSYHRGTRSDEIRDVKEYNLNENRNEIARSNSNTERNVQAVERSAVRTSREVEAVRNSSEANETARARNTSVRQTAPAAQESRSTRTRQQAVQTQRSQTPTVNRSSTVKKTAPTAAQPTETRSRTVRGRG